MTPLTDAINEVSRELEATSPRLAIRLRTIAIEALRIEQLMNEIIEDASEDERAQAKREVATKAAVVRDLAIERALNVQRLSPRYGGMAFLVHVVGDRT